MEPSSSPLRRVLVIGLLAVALPAGPASAADSGAAALSTRVDALASRDLRSAGPAEQAHAVSLPPRGAGSLMRDRGRPVVDIRVSGDVGDRVAGIREAGADVIATSPEDGLISAAVAEPDLRAVGNAAGVEAVTEVLTPMTGSVGADEAASGAINTCPTGTISEGNTQLEAGAARTHFDVDGTGIKVGILSDSFNTDTTAATHQADDVASGDLPGPGNPCGRTAPVQVLQDASGQADEGRAMAQIVHDMAPGANLAFDTAYPSDVAFAGNIRALANAGADAIVDDIIYFNEPFYQDGIIAKAVNDVTGDGVAYFTMAFNDNRVIAGHDSNSWEATGGYRSTACPPTVAALPGPDDCMDFNPSGGAPDPTFAISVPNGRKPLIDLQWAEPWYGVTTDFDLYLLDSTGAIVGSSYDDNPDTTKIPFELAGLTSTSNAAQNYRIVIQRYSGAGTPRLKWVNVDNGAQTISSMEYPTSQGTDVIGPTIFGHNGAANAQTVAAVPYYDSSTVESFSSRGPVTHYFAPVDGTTPAAPLATPEVLSKPDVAATDGVLNTFFPAPCGTCRFFGTSAAAPHAAGVAALQLDANRALTQSQVKAAQEGTARAVGAFGPLAVGAGLIDANAAIASRPPAAPTVALGPVASPTRRRSPSIPIATTGNLSSRTCSVDGGAAKACSAPFRPPPLKDGIHTVSARVTDYFGQSDTDAISFRVDTKGPLVKIKKGPKERTTKQKARFKFKTQRHAKTKCKLDRGKYAKCKSPAVFKVKPGKHRLLIRATDDLGNKGKPAAYRWKVVKP